MAIKFLNTVQVDTDVLYVNTANDRVGIGTTNPSVTLHVDGFARLNGGLQMNATNAQIYQILDSDLRFGTNNTERMRIDNTGNVGIGTTSPSSNLDIENASGVTIDINSSSGDGMFRFQDNGTTKWAIGRDNTQQNFVFSNSAGLASDNVLTLAHSTGNVGIGTTSPGSKLEISSTSDALLELNGGTTANPYMLFAQNGTRRAFIQYVNGGLLSLASEYGDIRFMTGAGGTETEKMRITSAGNVGIGTTSPDASLHVATDSAAGTFRLSPQDGIYENYRLDIRAQASDAGALTMKLKDNTFLKTYGYYNLTGVSHGVAGYEDLLHLKNNGNVGIGTTSPSARLNISGTGTGSAIDWTNTTATTGRSYRWVSLNAGGFAIEDLTASGAERMRITSSGDTDILDNDILIDSSHGFINSGPLDKKSKPLVDILISVQLIQVTLIFTQIDLTFIFNKALTVNGSSIINQNDIRVKNIL